MTAWRRTRNRPRCKNQFGAGSLCSALCTGLRNSAKAGKPPLRFTGVGPMKKTGKKPILTDFLTISTEQSFTQADGRVIVR
jgi:hypothetical protein